MPWALPAATLDTARLSLPGGIQLTLIRKGPYGDKLSTHWYKAGLQAPFWGRLACDGVRVNNGNAGAQIELRISGLPAGRHTLLTYHNNVDNPATNTFAPIDIYLNGVQKYDNLALSVRETVTANVPSAYLFADAVAGQDVVVLFAADTTTGASNKNFLINGIELNTSNPRYQAQLPYPKNADEHVNGDNGKVNLQWTNAANAVASRIYTGFDSASVAAATEASPQYRGRQTATSFTATNQYSMLTYFWRVDQEDADGNVTRGNVWYYRPRQLAFQDAEGYGRFARGGRGGKVVVVTNLNDNGPGSFREAVENDIGPRTIVFAVGGIIQLRSRLVLKSPYVTVAGQTAPGKGITIRSAPFGITGNDCIVRHMRVRLGGGPTYDGMGLTGANHSILDHCSISWTIDEAFSSRGAKNITLQRTLISEALHIAGHQNYPAGTGHGYAATIGGDSGSFHHNLLAHNAGRNWSMGGGLDGNGYYLGHLDIRNNVVYNWSHRTTDGGAHKVNFVNNYYKPGPASRIFFAMTIDHENVGLGTQQGYFSGNVMPGRFNESNQTAGRRFLLRNGAVVNYPSFVDTAFFEPYVTTQTARNAYKDVLSDVGCTQPVFDDHDIRVVKETRDSTTSSVGSKSGLPGIPDNEADVGGYEDYPETYQAANWDTDNDGMPNWWERLHRLNVQSAPGDFTDGNKDPDKDGFTHLDDYLEFMGGHHYYTRPFRLIKIDLKELTRGYTNKPVYSVSKMRKGLALQFRCINGIVFFLTPIEGIASFDFTVKDAEGSSMTRTIQVASSFDPSLPVEPLWFNGFRKDAGTVSLEWEHPQEMDKGIYELQRATAPNGPFTTVATFAGKGPDGQNPAANAYTTQDANDLTGLSYYRVVRTGANGKVLQSEVKEVEGGPAKVKIWPMPSKGSFQVLLTHAAREVGVRIFRADGSQVGREVLMNPGTPKAFQINAAGVYMVMGTDKQTGLPVFTNKVVIE